MNSHPPKEARYRGEAVYMFAFDLAYEMAREPVQQLLGEKVEQFKFDPSKRTPKHPFFFRPQMVRLPICKRIGPSGPIEIERVIKILPIGAISITARVPFEVERLEDLVDFHDLQFGDRSLHGEVREVAEKIYVELRPHLIRPMEYLAEEEAYTVFCLETGTLLPAPEFRAEDWLNAHRRAVAALLTQETDLEKLSEQEANESTSRYLSYYQNDLVVIDWDAALVVDEPKDFAEVIYVMELANLNLAELEAYDRLLDRALERSYRDLRGRQSRKRKEILMELREIRIDLARYNDELSNITKFFGDWHLARVYETIASRFHLGDWHSIVDEKLKTLDNLYQILQHDQSNRWMLTLEVTVVLLFIIDLIILFMGK
ncbi:MAG TPA: hypothetical protein VGR78_18535 [Verrucomicrobiae bacterium]|nr:hypothetical protein [Verrucomicrobiae bacterium]